MPRPSLIAQRREEILNAFERCVARYGVDGATLERTADEAGLQRSLIRHNVGNREDLLNALVDRFINKSNHDIDQLTSTIRESNSAKYIADYLFNEEYSDTQSILIAEALMVAAPNYSNIAPRMQKWVEDFSKSLAKLLREFFPDAKTADCRIVAAGIIGIYFNVESLTPLGTMKSFRQSSKHAALRLINTLN